MAQPKNQQRGAVRTKADRARGAAVPLELVPEIKRQFLEAFTRNGGIVIPAAESVNISRDTLYEWRRADSEFDAAWTAAFEQSADYWERELERRAMEGHDRPVIFQGHVTETFKEKSDPLLIMGLQARRRLYRNKTEVTGEGGGPVVLKIIEEVIEVAK